ncbi:MAG: 2-dehydropantoate 2-reductase [Ignavibacterium sp.]|nr:MAG: 2-dehydropantoate 2-reductase [Ignavibacterium sp.]
MDPEKFKIGIIGLGPVGLVLAVHLKEAGCRVELCDIEKEKMNLIRNSGVKLLGKIEKTSFFDYTHTSIGSLLEHELDILISAVKAYHVDSVLAQIQKGVNNDLFLLSAQNGIDIREKYTSLFDESQILRMVINFAGNLHAPNVVKVTFFNPPNYIASIDDSRTDIAEWLSAMLTKAQLETISKDSFIIANKIWEKTILNAALSPLCAISKMTMKEAMAHPDTLEIIEQIILEAVEVAKAEEIKFGDNFVKLCIRYLKNAGHHFPSLAVDLLSHKPTEIDYMNGKIVEYGRKHYIRTPLNLTFTNLVKAISHKHSQGEGEPELKDEIAMDI